VKAPYRFVPQGSKFAQLERGVPTGKTYASFEAARSETLRLNDAWRSSHGKRKNPSWESEMALHPHMLIDYDKRIGRSSAPMSRAEFDAYLASLKEEKEEKAAPRASASLPEDYEKLWAAQHAFAPHLLVRNSSRRRNSNGERLARETADLAAAEKELAFLLPLKGKAPQFDERIEYLRDIIAGLRGDILLSKKANPSRRRNYAETPTLFWHDDKSYFSGGEDDQIARSGPYTLRIWKSSGDRHFHVQREEEGMKAYPLGERTTLTAAKELAQRHLDDMLRAYPNRRNSKSRRNPENERERLEDQLASDKKNLAAVQWYLGPQAWQSGFRLSGADMERLVAQKRQLEESIKKVEAKLKR